MSKFRNTQVFDCYKKTRTFFNEWSPIGHVPEDEYDDICLQICSLINKGASGKEVMDFTFNYLRHSIGLKDIDRNKVEMQLKKLFELLYAV